jgi:hypothetical protein
MIEIISVGAEMKHVDGETEAVSHYALILYPVI